LVKPRKKRINFLGGDIPGGQEGQPGDDYDDDNLFSN